MAGLQRATGYPDYSSTSTPAFVPQIWSGKLITKLYERTCFGEIANTDYEGEITRQGDKVIIRTVPTITIRDHQIGGTLNYETPTSEHVELNIDKGKYFAFEIDDVDAYQSDLNLMDDWADDGGQQMKISIDASIMGSAYADVAPENAGATAGVRSEAYDMGAPGAPLSVTKGNILDIIVDAGSVLDEQNVPDDQRWITLPAWMNGMLKKSDLRDAGIMGDDTSVFRNGKVGRLDRFDVYISNQLGVANDSGGARATNVMFGHKKALTFASQMTEMDTMKNPAKFGNLVRGLNVYGWDVIDPNAMGHMYVTKG